MYEICFIDDTIPAVVIEDIDETKRLNSSNLFRLLKGEVAWGEEDVRKLTISLLEKPEWSVSAFTHPSFYLNAIENMLYRPDIIIYDWEYAAGDQDSATMLIEILQKTFAVIYIYSGGDHEEQIRSALTQPELKTYYNKRLFVLMKDTPDSQDMLLKQATIFFKNNFSFRFGSQLRVEAIKALDQVLVNLGSHDIDFVKQLLADGESIETDIKKFILEKVRHHLLESEILYESLKSINRFDDLSIREILGIFITKFTTKINSTQINMNIPHINEKIDDEKKEIAKSLWSQRIYYKPSDNLVRRGDIVTNDSNDRQYIIITADCDLSRFWHKNYGFINLIPLYNCSRDADIIKTKLLMTRNMSDLKKQLKGKKISSLTGKIPGISEGPFLVPYVIINDEMLLFIGFPKEIISLEVAPPDVKNSAKERQGIPLSYDQLNAFKREMTISEPFVTAIVQHCISSISGYGTPDYNSAIQAELPEKLNDLLV